IFVPNTNNSCDDDVAMLALDSAVPAAEATPAGVSLTNLTTHHDSSVAIVGRGAISEHLDPITFQLTRDKGNFYRRILTNIPFLCVSNQSGVCSITDITTPGNLFVAPSSYFIFGGSTIGGDSGAGIFNQNEFDQGNYNVIGVSSAYTFDTNG